MTEEKIIAGKIISKQNPDHVFNSGDTLKVDINHGTIFHHAYWPFGGQTIELQEGQQFPINFQFSYKPLEPNCADGVFLSAEIKNQSSEKIYVAFEFNLSQDNLELNAEKYKPLPRGMIE